MVSSAAGLWTPWRRYPDEAAAYLRMSPTSFKRKVRDKVKCKKSGGVELYHVKDLDQWEEDEKATSSNPDQAVESYMSPAQPLTGALCIGPLERALAKKLRNGSR